MPAYLIGAMKVADKEKYTEYKLQTPSIISKYGGRFLSRGGCKIVLEGDDDGCRIVVVEFPSLAQARAFYYSEEYQAAKRVREKAAEIALFAVEGFEAD